MKITVDPANLPSLLAFLGRQGDCIWTLSGDGEVDVGIIGSYADGGAAELDRRLAAWRAQIDGDSAVTESRRAPIALPARRLSPLRTPRR